MRKTMLRIATLLSLLLLISFAVIVVNQTSQLVTLADRVHPTFGTAVFWSLIALYGFCLIVPLFLRRAFRARRSRLR
jgi:TRAP-type C4-dicarboxylate transport system permease small subunit